MRPQAIYRMALNPFIGRDRAWLEERLRETQDELGSGMSATSGNLAEVSFGAIMTIGPMKRLEFLLAALNRIDPVTYPADATTVPTRTIATFSGMP